MIRCAFRSSMLVNPARAGMIQAPCEQGSPNEP